ncbi:MAG: flagellar hook assembly protein FlgD, partial [Rhodospirillales bacterium]|nr:flagellar hook assembly protein FlgD [Rhodospirillales bacterium]
MAEAATIDPVSGAPITKSEKSKHALAADLDSFLLLLTTQLKNQDPLSPLDPTDFTGQLVQFASVEQQITSNANLEKLVEVQNLALASSIIGFVGTDVEAEIGQVPLQNHTAQFSYDLASNAQNVIITISDDKGNVMLTKAGERAAGKHEFVWDGKDGNDILQPDGGYAVSVTAVDFESKAVNSKLIVRGHVSGVSMDNG